MAQVTQNGPTLVELAEEILKKAKQLQAAIPKSPTFFNDTLSGPSADNDAVRKELIDTTEILNALARGVNGFSFSRLSRIILAPYDEMSLRVNYHFRVAQRVPLETSISFTDLAKACNVEGNLLTRLLRHAMVLHFFHEPKKGYIAHTIDSRRLATEADLFDAVGCLLEDMGVGSQTITKAMEKWPGSDERNHSACCYAYNTDVPFYAYLRQFPERMRPVSSMMRWVGESQAGSQTQITTLYPWQDLGNGTIVDMGGGNGQVIIPIAREYPLLKFIVQDLEGASEQGKRTVAEDMQLRDRIDFMTHDFHQVDMIVLANTNGRVRTLEEILKVLEMADSRFKREAIHTVKGSPFMVVEMIWKP